jgi:GNAT superfamily N-acetyltransferase
LPPVAVHWGKNCAGFSKTSTFAYKKPWAGSGRVGRRSPRYDSSRIEAFLAGFEHLSPESRYLRFFTPMPRLPKSVLDRLLHADGIDHVAVSAWRDVGDGTTEPIGVARFVRLERRDTAEAAIAVVDHMHARGVGRVLLADLFDAARERGVSRFRAEIMVGNQAVVGLLHEIGAKAVAAEGNIAVYELDVPGAPHAKPAHDVLVRMLGWVARGLATLRHQDLRRGGSSTER